MQISKVQRLLYSPHLAQLVVTRRCNLRCGYCSEYDRKSDPIEENILVERISKLKSLGTFGIEFTGGEPLLHPGIYRLLARATQMKYLTRWMITNAYLLDEDSITRLNASGLSDMQISIDGVEPNKTTVKVLRPLRSKLELLSRMARFRVTISAVVGAAPSAEVWEVVRFAKERGFRPRVLLLHDQRGKLKLTDEEMSLYRDLQHFLRKGSREAHSYRHKLMQGHKAPFKCRAGSRYLYVDEFGMVHRCSQTMPVYSKPLMDYSLEDLHEQFYAYKPCHPYCTLGCARTASKFDEWRSQKNRVSPNL